MVRGARQRAAAPAAGRVGLPGARSRLREHPAAGGPVGAETLSAAGNISQIGATSASNTILIPHSPGHLSDLSSQLRDAADW